MSGPKQAVHPARSRNFFPSPLLAPVVRSSGRKSFITLQDWLNQATPVIVHSPYALPSSCDLLFLKSAGPLAGVKRT